MDAAAHVTRQDIVNFPFPYKLWIVVNLEFCDFLRWNRDGTAILVDIVSLEDYLNSNRSIFKIKNGSVFIEHLDKFKFERLNAMPEAGEDLLLQYKNENFQRHRLDLVARIRRYAYQLIGEISINKGENLLGGRGTNDNRLIKSNSEQTLEANNRVAERMMGDLCFMFHGGLSNINTSRLRFQTILNFQNETRLIEQKLKAADEYNATQRLRKSDPSARSAASGSVATDKEHVIEVPVDLFENPHDSVLHLDEDFPPEYAGYYGNCSKEQVKHFFGDYLPMYEDAIIIAENSNTNKNDLNSQAEAQNKQSFYPNQNNIGDILTSNPVAQCPIINLNLSSGLEPFFKTEQEEQEYVDLDPVNVPQLNTYNMDNDIEISMDEFITFKGSSNESNANTKEIKNKEYYDMHQTANESLRTTTAMKSKEHQCSDLQQQAVAKQFPLMPAAVKMEIEENAAKNEANFRSFFSQYRDSLNLLYDFH